MGTNPHNSDPETQPKKEYHPPKLVEYGDLNKITNWGGGPNGDGGAEESVNNFGVPDLGPPG